MEPLYAGGPQRHACYAGMRDSPVRPVTLPSGETAWLVTGHEAAREALSHPRLRGRTGAVGDRRRLPEDVHRGMNTHMLNLEPPDHTRLRRLVSAVFTARRTGQLQPRVEQITGELLDDMADRDEVDLIGALALPLPIRVLTGILGVPDEDHETFHGWTTTLTASSLPLDQLGDAATQMLAYVRDLLERKRHDPGDDVLSALAAVRDGADRLTEHELTSMVFLLLIAGHETTVNLIGNSVLTLLTQPELLARLRADETLLPAAIEEFLRHQSPVQVALRSSTAPVELASVTIPANSTVIVSLLAANRDPDRFSCPDTFMPSRAENQHVAFGYGIHHCLGAPLARLEGKVAIGALISRFPRLRLASPEETLNWRKSLVMHGLEALPVRLS